jgi:hypothetical protein
VRQVNQKFYTLHGQQILKADGRVVSKVNPNSAEILDVIGVPVPEAPPEAPPSPEEALIEQVIGELAPRSLLEVGARSARVVRHSAARRRVAVSTRFDFDTRTYASEGLAFYELDLDRYSEVFHGSRGPFDVIRIAADDFDDFMGSFRASLQLSDDATVWLFGSGELASRAALAVRLAHPGYGPRRLLVGTMMMYVVRRVSGAPADESAVPALPLAEVKRRVRWLAPTFLRLLSRSRHRRPEPPGR